jgi:hypothetical protein
MILAALNSTAARFFIGTVFQSSNALSAAFIAFSASSAPDFWKMPTFSDVADGLMLIVFAFVVTRLPPMMFGYSFPKDLRTASTAARCLAAITGFVKSR